MEQYVPSLKQDADTAWPLAILPEQVATAVEHAMKGRPGQEVARRARQVVRDVLFLFHLHQEVNGKLMEEQKAFLYRLRWLRAELERLRYQKLGHQASPSGIHTGVLKRQDVTRWQAEAELFLEELHGLRLTVMTISKRYFGEHELLFPALKEGLIHLVKAMEALVEMSNEDLAPTKEARVDVATLEAKAGTAYAARVAFLIDLARAEALDVMGENSAAVAIVEGHI